MGKKIIVISGINLYSGGPLSVFYDCLDSLILSLSKEEYHIIAFVHKKNLFDKYKNEIEIIELPLSRKKYLFRLYYEYLYFYFYSVKRDIYMWLSLHDITPNVRAKYLYTYCHNPSSFLKFEWKYLLYSKSLAGMILFYKYIYKINIKKATGIIVQQEWIRKEFKKNYGIENVIVSRPVREFYTVEKEKCNNTSIEKKKVFIFPSYPRAFKNFEVIFESVKYLNSKKIYDYEIILTIDGTENKYTRHLRKKYSNLKNVIWMGAKTREEVFKLYSLSDALIFPSKMETWGLPISEYKLQNKPILLADMPYAHETIGEYDKCIFFRADSFEDLGNAIRQICDCNNGFLSHNEIKIEYPFCNGWNELINLLNGL